MKRICILICALMPLLPARAQAVPPDSIPQPSGWTNDFEHIFTVSEINTLDSIIHAFEKETSVEIAIITLDTSYIGNRDFDELTRKIARKWRPGKKDKNNGILIAISAGKRKMYIHNADGIGTLMSDGQTHDIIQKCFIPAYKNGGYFRGTKEGLEAIIKLIRSKL